jgi:hypothetical protein
MAAHRLLDGGDLPWQEFLNPFSYQRDDAVYTLADLPSLGDLFNDTPALRIAHKAIAGLAGLGHALA